MKQHIPLLIKNINKVFSYSLIIAFINYYLWFRFIRERLPKEIPFALSLFNSFIIITICGIFIYIILQRIKPKNANILTKKFITFYARLFIFLYNIDDLLKKNYLIKNYIENMLLFLLKKLNPFTLYSKGEKIYILYILSLRIVLLVVFLLDVLYFHEIRYTYNFILIGLINLFIAYFIYSIKILELNYLELLKEYFIEITSKDDDPHTDYYLDPSTISYDIHLESQFDKIFNYLNILHFIELQSTAIMFDHTPYNYKCLHKSQRQDLINLSPQNFNTLSENNIEKILQLLLNIKIIFETLHFLEKRRFIKNLQIIIHSLYLFCWLYILFVSLHTFYFTELESLFLHLFQDKIEPFSGTIMIVKL